MLSYRFYWLKPDGRIDTASNLEFADDHAATIHAQHILEGSAIEVWQGARKICQLGLPNRMAV